MNGIATVTLNAAIDITRKNAERALTIFEMESRLL